MHIMTKDLEAAVRSYLSHALKIFEALCQVGLMGIRKLFYVQLFIIFMSNNEKLLEIDTLPLQIIE